MLTMNTKKFIAKIIAAIFFSTICINNIPIVGKTAEAAASDEHYLKVVRKYLELGTAGKESYDFNLIKGTYAPGDELYWYIRPGKGTPECITINHRTGVVTVKSAGTAYIRCRITRNGEVMARPEAKVTVYNKITKVEISNLPADLTIPAGQTMDFNRTILNTAAGTNAEANGITRWELAEDTAGVNEVSDQGQLLPIQPGAFKIRAICFKNQADYQAWRMNKEKKSSSITAASDWYTIQVSDSSGIGYVTNQKELEKLLEAPRIIYIICDTNFFTDITIPDGDYSNKTLIFDAPEPAKAASATAKSGELQSFSEPMNITGKDALIAEVLKMSQGNANSPAVDSLSGSQQIRAVIMPLQIKALENAAKSEYSFEDPVGGIDDNSLINLVFGNGISADISRITEENFYKLFLYAAGYDPRTDGYDFSTSVAVRAHIVEGASIHLLPGSEGTSIFASPEAMPNLLIDNQSRGIATLLVDKLKLPIGNGVMTPDMILQAIKNAQNTNQTPQADKILAEVHGLVQTMPYQPLPDEVKTSVSKVQAAILEVVKQELAAYQSVIHITINYESKEYTATITCGGKELNVNVTDKFFNDQDTSITVLPEGSQYIKAVSGSAITVVSGSSIRLLVGSYIVQGESGFLIPPDTYPYPDDLVTADMCIDVYARDNVTKKRYTIVLQDE